MKSLPNPLLHRQGAVPLITVYPGVSMAAAVVPSVMTFCICPLFTLSSFSLDLFDCPLFCRWAFFCCWNLRVSTCFRSTSLLHVLTEYSVLSSFGVFAVAPAHARIVACGLRYFLEGKFSFPFIRTFFLLAGYCPGRNLAYFDYVAVCV